MVSWRKCKKPLILLFIALNLVTVLAINLPPFLQKRLDSYLSRDPSSHHTFRTQQVLFFLKRYAFWTGLDPRWEMFSHVKGPDWRYLIEGVCDHGAWILPLPGQSKMGFWNDLLFDFKEGKFRLNTAANPVGRHSYAQFLCRKFSGYHSHPLREIRINIQYQKILEPKEASRLNTHYDPQIETHPLEVLSCS
jgi:hypothetical protein